LSTLGADNLLRSIVLLMRLEKSGAQDLVYIRTQDLVYIRTQDLDALADQLQFHMFARLQARHPFALADNLLSLLVF
jgi:hypothetical protein